MRRERIPGWMYEKPRICRGVYASTLWMGPPAGIVARAGSRGRHRAHAIARAAQGRAPLVQAIARRGHLNPDRPALRERSNPQSIDGGPGIVNIEIEKLA